MAQMLKAMAHRLRIHTILATESAKSGHPSSCSSIAEIMAVLFFKVMRLNIKAPRDPSSDRLVLSKGHAAPILYAAWAEAGLFPVADLLNLRKVYSDLEGHPTPRLNFIDAGTGSLGQGLAIGNGMAYVGKHYDKADYRTYVIVGDGESTEGSIWESLHFASLYKLDNLCVIFDVNRFGQTGPTSLDHKTDVYENRLNAFGFNSVVIDGHNVEELIEAFEQAANTKEKPTAIIAKTLKGKDFPDVEDKDGWHGKVLGDKAEAAIKHLEDLIKKEIEEAKECDENGEKDEGADAADNEECEGSDAEKKPKIAAKQKGEKNLKPQSMECMKTAPSVNISSVRLSQPPNYQKTDKIHTREAYGNALVKLAQSCDRVIALDAYTKSSTFSVKLLKAFPERHIECFVAEQNLVGVAIGTACRDRTIAFASTFGAFFTRSYDQLRMGAISQTNVNFSGCNSGISVGEDGPSQMALEDLAMFRAIPGSTVFYPSDAVSCERAVELAANTSGICFIRTTRPITPIIYKNEEMFEVGKGKIVKQSPNDEVLLIGAGITLFECLKAADELAKSGLNARILDPFTIKPLDEDLIVGNARACGGRIVVVEDHYQQGGIGEAILSLLAPYPNIFVKHLFVPTVPRSGPAATLLDKFGISTHHIVNAANLVRAK